MDFIQHNPYRIVGVLSNATTRELEKQKGKIKAFVRVGREIESDFDFRILEGIDRSEEIVNQSFSSIEQNQDKVDYALFWFLNASPFDNTAIEYLKNGDEEKATEIWEKVTANKEVNSKNFSAFNNLGTLNLLSQSKSDIKSGIEAKIKLIESDYFENFVHSVADETYTIDQQKQAEKLIDELLTQFKNQFSSSETLQLFNGCTGTTQQYLSKKFTEEPLHKIESQIERCKKARKVSKGNAYEYGLRLFTNTKEDLSLLKSLLSTSDLKYKSVADQLANEIMQCGIDYFKECQGNKSGEDFLKQAQELNETALSVAVGSLVRDRAKDHISTLEEMKEQELNQAVRVLQSIKDAYDNNARQLMAQVKEQESKMDYGQSINWTKVNQLINDSINWDKATQLLTNVIPRENIDKIKNAQNTSKISEYKRLVEFVLDKVNYSYKSRIKYLKYWEAARRASTAATRSSSTNRPNPSYQSTESEFSFSENAWWILGVAGVVVGLMMGFGWGCIITGFIGLVIGSKFSN